MEWKNVTSVKGEATTCQSTVKKWRRRAFHGKNIFTCT